jgi:hypothetical protein
MSTSTCRLLASPRDEKSDGFPLNHSSSALDRWNAAARAPDAGVYLLPSESTSGTGTLFSGPLSTHCVTCMCPVISAKVRAMPPRVSRVAAAEAGRVQLKVSLFKLSLSVLMETIA